MGYTGIANIGRIIVQPNIRGVACTSQPDSLSENRVGPTP